MVSITTVATWHTGTANLWADLRQCIIDRTINEWQNDCQRPWRPKHCTLSTGFNFVTFDTAHYCDRNAIHVENVITWSCFVCLIIRWAVYAESTRKCSNWYLCNGRCAVESVAFTRAESGVGKTRVHVDQSHMWRGMIRYVVWYEPAFQINWNWK